MDTTHRHTPHIYNWLSFAGVLLSLFALLTSLAFIVFEATAGEVPSYMGMLYLLLMGLLVFGIVLVPAGVLMERSRRARGGAPSQLDRVTLDLTRASHRWILLGGLAIFVVVSASLAVGSFKTFQAMETTGFCGQLCHSVMSPEYTTYSHSSHARVRCVECHIGPGASWFVRSKISGIRQVFAVMANDFPRPIPTPIHNLRPARETCERCHWPSKFIGYREIVRSYYLSDEKNTPHRVRMLMKIGGEKSESLGGAGIHYHMLLAAKVEYIARDKRRQKIAWVRIHRNDGSETVYADRSDPLTPEERKKAEVRVMDCMDCHNRPAHRFRTPMQSVNEALEVGAISADLPSIKLEATRALGAKYPDTPAAMVGIANTLRAFYKDEYPQVFAKRESDVTQAIRETQTIFKRSIFPKMNADWKSYPDNIGHRDWPGCFRCHNEDMVNSSGEPIFSDCTKCHLILAQGKNVTKGTVNFEKGLPFYHPGDQDFIKDYTQCTDCHDGGPDLYD